MIYRAGSKRLKIAPLFFVFFLYATFDYALAADKWFEEFKSDATDKELYRFLYSMPKGGDLHNHMSGSGFPEWWYELALEQVENGYEYYTKVQINNCRSYDHDEFGGIPYKMYFRNITRNSYEELSDCEKSEYKPIEALNAVEKEGWLSSIKLDKEHEGRDVFFRRHWERLDALTDNPFLMSEILFRNMKAFGDEGLMYLETMLGSRGFSKPDGTPIPPEDVADIYRDRLAQDDARETGVTVRMQESVLRFAPGARQDLVNKYRFVSENDDLYVALNMVGREVYGKGHPMRFKDTLRELRHQYSNVDLSIHAGEVDVPRNHVRDTLIIGADRIGHGLQLINDEDLMQQMRYGPYLIETNLISNLLLKYVDDYSEHPFPEFLRLGVPTALSTDDRGMWDSNITDEFFVAVKEFNLSWDEIKELSINSISYSFLEDELREDLVNRLQERFRDFEELFRDKGMSSLEGKDVISHGFICRHYDLCAFTVGR